MKPSKFRHTLTHLCMLEDRLNHHLLTLGDPRLLCQRSCNQAVKHHSQRYFSCPCLCRYYFLSTLDYLFSRTFFIFFPSSSPGTPPVLSPSSPFLPLCHTLLFGFSSSHFSPSCLPLSSLLFLTPWRPLLFPLVCKRCPSSLPPRLFCIPSFCVLSSFHLSLCAPYPIISTLHSSSPFSNNPV